MKASLRAPVLLSLLVAVPLVFAPGYVLEEYEFPKVILLVTAALIPMASWLAGELARLGLWGAARWIRTLGGRVGAAARRDPIGAALFFFLIAAAASATMASAQPALSFFGAPQSRTGLLTILSLAAIYYSSRALGGATAWLGRIAMAAAIAAAVASAYALLGALGVEPLARIGRLTFSGATSAGGTLGSPRTLAAYLALSVPLAVWLAARARSRPARIGWIGCGALILLGIVVGLWRSAEFSSAAWEARAELWRTGLRMARDYPVLGVGLDAFGTVFPAYRTAEMVRIGWTATPMRAGNEAVQILATQGFLGGLAALAIVLLTARALARARRGSPDQRAAAAAVGAALLLYGIAALLGLTTISTDVLAVALAGWAAASAHAGDAAKGAHERHAAGPGVARPVWAYAAGGALALLAWVTLVLPLVKAELLVARAVRYAAGSAQRSDLLAEAATITPWDSRLYAELGRSLFAQALGERDPDARLTLLLRARGALLKSTAIAPESAENAILLASVISAQSALRPGSATPEDVRRAFRGAVALDPLNPAVLVAAERGFLAAGLDADAREIAVMCASLYSDFGPPLADLGAIALAQGRPAGAADTLRLAVRRKWRGDVASEANAWSDLARASFTLGLYEAARDAADSALARDSRVAEAFGIREAARRAIELRH